MPSSGCIYIDGQGSSLGSCIFYGRAETLHGSILFSSQIVCDLRVDRR